MIMYNITNNEVYHDLRYILYINTIKYLNKENIGFR